jgi:hypothetical protein
MFQKGGINPFFRGRRVYESTDGHKALYYGVKFSMPEGDGASQG